MCMNIWKAMAEIVIMLVFLWYIFFPVKYSILE